MISADRFIASSTDFDVWLQARTNVVTATQVAKAATDKGFEDAVAEIFNPTTIEDNPYMAFGRDNERWIVLELKKQFGILPNDWLIASEEADWMTATPDGLSPDHGTAAEVKTTGKDWGDWSKVPIHYRRQVQWQLFVTGAEVAVFAWLLREESNNGFVPAWFEPKSVLVERDDKVIAQLKDVAARLHSVIKERQGK